MSTVKFLISLLRLLFLITPLQAAQHQPKSSHLQLQSIPNLYDRGRVVIVTNRGDIAHSFIEQEINKMVEDGRRWVQSGSNFLCREKRDIFYQV